MLRGPVVILAAALTSPALYAAFVENSLPVDQAILRFLAAVAFCTVGAAVLKMVIEGVGALQGDPKDPGRRRDDAGTAGPGGGS